MEFLLLRWPGSSASLPERYLDGWRRLQAPRRFVWKLQSWGRWRGVSRRHELIGSRLDVVHPQGPALMRSNHGKPWEKACEALTAALGTIMFPILSSNVSSCTRRHPAALGNYCQVPHETASSRVFEVPFEGASHLICSWSNCPCGII